MSQNKKPYQAPQLLDFGKVSDLTSQVGMTFLTDSFGTGSMEFPGMGMDMSMGM